MWVLAGVKLARIAILAIVAAVIGIVAMFFSVVGGIFPSGSKNVISMYQAEVKSVSGSINWEDVYLLDYFRLQNDFRSISNQQILSSARQFLGPMVREPNPLYDKKHPKKHKKYIYVQTYYSLLDVMTHDGYSHDEYNLALQLKDVITYQAPLLPVAVKELRFQFIPVQSLYDYVHARNSAFTLHDISVIEAAGKKYDVNPALLVAITGQEQGFVPVNTPDEALILNNPFNVYHSWQDYNTNLADASDIAANTVAHKLSTPPPQGENAIQWINDPNNPWGIYAQDHNWSYGVQDIFNSIQQYLGNSPS